MFLSYLRKFGFIACLIASTLWTQEDKYKEVLSIINESEILYFQKFVEGINRFGFDLFRHSRHQAGSLCLSSYGIASGLGLIEIGVKGKTEQEFQQVLGYSPALLLFVGDLNATLEEVNSSGTQTSIANALWLDQSISVLPAFKQTLMRNFRSVLQPVDFAQSLNQTIQKINQWTSKETKSKVNHMISPQDLSYEMRIVLTAGAYLKGGWALPFDQKKTKRLPFQVGKQRTVMADMMENTGSYLMTAGQEEDVLAMPLRSDGQVQLNMVILLPKNGIALNEWEKNFTWENWKGWKGQLKSQQVALTLPSFHIDRRLDLEMILKAMGLTSIFSSQADLSRMTNQKEVFLNQFIHRTSIDVDERGINVYERNASKTAVTAPEKEIPLEFKADHPFVFMIWDQKSDLILFVGRLSIP